MGTKDTNGVILNGISGTKDTNGFMGLNGTCGTNETSST